MKTVTDVNTVNQLLTYSKQAEAGIHQKAIQMLLGEGKHTYLLQESGKTINVDAKIKQLNDIKWIEIGYKEGDTFSVYGKEYALTAVGISMFRQKMNLHQRKLNIQVVQYNRNYFKFQ